MFKYLYKYFNKLLLKIAPTTVIRLMWNKRGVGYINNEIGDAYRLMYEDLAILCLKETPLRILEYGCGYGYLSKIVFEKNQGYLKIEHYGIDYSSTQIENAKNYFKEGNFYVCDITKRIDMFEDDAFDVVIGVSVLMYIQPDLIDNAIKELLRICKNKLFVVEYYYKYLSKAKQDSYKQAFYGDGRRIYDYESLLFNNGFKNVKIMPIEYFHNKEINIEGIMPQTLIVAEK